MSGRFALFLCAGLLIWNTSFAQGVVAEKPKQGTKTAQGKPDSPIKDCGISEVAGLLAANDGVVDKKKLSEYTKSINKIMGYNVASEEDLQYPSIELYGENSWRNDAINPFFGDVRANVPDSFAVDLSQFVYPLDELKRVTSRYGYRRRFRRMHYGIDISLTVGDTVRAAFDGKVRLVAFDRRGYGNYIIVRHTNGLETLYAHNSRIIAEEDQIVHAGDPIALGGNTGRSTGPHLHFEARYLGQALNPELLIDFHNGVPLMEEYICLSKNYRGGTGAGQINKQPASTSGHSIKMHRIRQGETLSVIAKRYGTSVNKLCRLNNMTARSVLRVGRSIRVS